MELTLEQKIELLKLVEPHKEKLSITFYHDNTMVSFKTIKALCLSNVFGNKEFRYLTYVDNFEKFKKILKERMKSENGES